MSLRASEVFAPRRNRGRPERDAQRAILKYLRLRGCLVVVTDAGAAYRAGSFGADTVPAGWPDITGLLPDGRFIGVEVKSQVGRQSPVQKQMEEAIRQRNGIYVLARSIEDVEDVVSDSSRSSQFVKNKPLEQPSEGDGPNRNCNTLTPMHRNDNRKADREKHGRDEPRAVEGNRSSHHVAVGEPAVSDEEHARRNESRDGKHQQDDSQNEHAQSSCLP